MSFARSITLLAITIILSLPPLVNATSQATSQTQTRGKNGQAHERKPDERKPQPYPASSPGVRPDSQEPRADRVAESSESKLAGDDHLKLAVDLVVLDAQVVQQRTGRAIGDLHKDDFVLTEDGVKQQITHFSQDTLPLSVILLIDRGGCLDPYSEKVRHATQEALKRLGPRDEVALMAFADTTDLIAGFGRGQDRILEALDRVPAHDENAGHCFSKAFADAADYMRSAGNPDGRRVIIVITGITSYFDCGSPSPQEARMAILESGSVICAIIPKTAEQQLENGIMRAAAGIGGLFRAKSSSLKQLAEETGGEVMIEKPEVLDHTFNTLIDHLRTRYALGFVSTNKKRDGTFRKLKLELAHQPQKREERLVVRTKRGYLAAKDPGGLSK